MFAANHIYFDYDDVPVLDDVSLAVQSGQLWHVRGDNGRGKTTLLKIMAGLMTPCQGSVDWEGAPIDTQRRDYCKQMSYVGHRLGLNATLTPWENLSLNPENTLSKSSLFELFDAFAIKHLMHHPCALLSAGQKRKVSLMHLFLKPSKLWLLDEPFVALDAGVIAFLSERMTYHITAGGMIVLTSHQPMPESLGANQVLEL